MSDKKAPTVTSGTPTNTTVDVPQVTLPQVTCTLEVDDGKCGNFLWNPTLEVLRGRFSRYNTPGNSLPNRFSMVPDILGIRLHIDVPNRRVSIFDPYATLQAHLHEIDNALKLACDQRVQVMATRTTNNASINELATFLYHAVHGVQSGALRVIEGSLPYFTMEDFEKFGSHIIISNHTNNTFQRKTLGAQITAIRDGVLV